MLLRMYVPNIIGNRTIIRESSSTMRIQYVTCKREGRKHRSLPHGERFASEPRAASCTKSEPLWSSRVRKIASAALTPSKARASLLRAMFQSYIHTQKNMWTLAWTLGCRSILRTSNGKEVKLVMVCITFE